MTPKQQRFCSEYLIDLNGTQAAIRAGYSPKTSKEQATRLLTNVSIKAKIEDSLAKQRAKTELSAQYVLDSLLEVANRCQQRVPVMVSNGKERVQATNEAGAGVWKFDSAGANRALELLGKYFTLFKEQYDVNVTGLDAKMREAEERIKAEQAGKGDTPHDPTKAGE